MFIPFLMAQWKERVPLELEAGSIPSLMKSDNLKSVIHSLLA